MHSTIYGKDGRKKSGIIVNNKKHILIGDGGIMRFWEQIKDFYIKESEWLLWMVVILLLIVVAHEGYVNYKANKKYILHEWLQYIMISIILICTAQGLRLFGVDVSGVNILYELKFLIMGGTFIVLYSLFQGFIFRKKEAIIIPIFKYFPWVLYVELFLQSITNRLRIQEWSTIILITICIEIVGRRLLEQIKDENKHVYESDYENDDLYSSRVRQLDSFISNLENVKNEPYGVMISGEWGTGKSSFIKALKLKLKDDIFIDIKTGAEKSVPEIMRELSNDILNMLKENNIFVENSSVIDRYFRAFSEVNESVGYKYFKVIYDELNMRTLTGEDYLNTKLKELGKQVYIIVDDLDRCDIEHQEKLFKVIRESMNFENCKTIFLVDKDNFLSEENRGEYLEKYVSYSINLVQVSYDDIADKYIDKCLCFDNDLKCLIDEKITLDDIKDKTYRLPKQILDGCEARKSDQDGSETDDNPFNMAVLDIKKNMSNSRKVKHYFKNVKKAIMLLDLRKQVFQSELQEKDWLSMIIKVQFLKNFLPQVYDEIQMFDTIQDYWVNCSNCVVAYIFANMRTLSYLDEDELIMLNEILYHWDAVDFQKIKTEKEISLIELRSGEFKVERILDYIVHAECFADMNSILGKYCMHMEDEKSRQEFLESFFDKVRILVSKRFIEFDEIESFTRKSIADFSKIGLSSREKFFCANQGKDVARYFISYNTNNLKNIFLLTMQITDIRDNWDIINNIDTLYSNLYKIDKSFFGTKQSEDESKLEIIKRYYASLKTKLEKTESPEVLVEFNESFNSVNKIFMIYKLWDDIEQSLATEIKRPSDEFCFYFRLGSSYTYKDTVFYSSEDLEKALIELNNYYDSLEDQDYSSLHAQIFLSTLEQMVIKSEEEPDWFRSIEKNLMPIVQSIKNLLCDLENERSIEIEEIKIYAYRFKKFCESIRE